MSASAISMQVLTAAKLPPPISMNSQSLPFPVPVTSGAVRLNDPSPIVLTSKINVVDLAGSEKLDKTNATGDTVKEGCNININSALATVMTPL